jgi:hypothetical protein
MTSLTEYLPVSIAFNPNFMLHRKCFEKCMEELEIDAGDYEYRMNIKKQNKKNMEEVVIVKDTKPTPIEILTNKINNFRRMYNVYDLTKKYGKYCWGLYYGNQTRSRAVIVAYRNNKYSIPNWKEIKTMSSSIGKTFKSKNEFIEWIKNEALLQRNNI